MPLLYSHTMARAALLALLVFPLFAAEEQDRNQALARRYFEEAWMKGNAAVAAEIFAPKYKSFDPRGRMGAEESSDVQVNIVRQWCAEGGDCSGSEIVWQMAEGDRVATYWILRYRPKKFPATLIASIFGRVPMERRVLSVFRFENGRVTETVNQRDDLGIYADFGIYSAGAVTVFALGGALGMFLMWFIRRPVRR